MTKEELKNYLVNEAEYDRETVNGMTPFELYDAWLEWNGIIGYGSALLNVINAAYSDTLLEPLDEL